LNTSQETSLTLPPLPGSAVATDLDRLWDIRYANDVAGQIAVPDQDPTPAYLAHLQEHGSLLVAESGGRIVGYAGLVDRGGFAYLTDLFVDPASQSLSIGRQLLEQILPTDSRTTCTLATTDYRAISLYTRAGMAPRWPNLLLEVSVGRLREISLPRIEMFSADPFDPALHRWDHAASGRDRPVDLSFMVHAEQGQPFWFGKGGEIIGYGIIRFNAIRPWRPDTVTIGPIGAATACERPGVRSGGRALGTLPRSDHRDSRPRAAPGTGNAPRGRLYHHLRGDLLCLRCHARQPSQIRWFGRRSLLNPGVSSRMTDGADHIVGTRLRPDCWAIPQLTSDSRKSMMRTVDGKSST
jgi:GNAT superfamily N-acetyltransferase